MGDIEAEIVSDGEILNIPDDTSISLYKSQFQSFIESYGWFIIICLIILYQLRLYLLKKHSKAVVEKLKNDQTIRDRMLESRIRMQKKWDEEKYEHYERARNEKVKKKAKKYQPTKKLKGQYNVDYGGDGLPNYRPDISSRYGGRGG